MKVGGSTTTRRAGRSGSPSWDMSPSPSTTTVEGGLWPTRTRSWLVARRCGNEPDRIRALAGAGLQVLLGESRAEASRVAAVGYCFGGALVLELARGGADVKAVVGFH